MSAAVLPVYVRGAGFSGGGALSVAAASRFEFAAALAGDGVLSVAVHVVGEEIEVAAPLAGDGVLSVDSFQRLAQPAAFAGDGALSVDTVPRFAQAAPFAGEGTLSVSAVPRFAQVANYSGAGALSVTVQVVPQRAAAFAGDGALSVLTLPRSVAAAALSGEGTLSVTVLRKTDWSDDFNRADGALGANWSTFALGADTTVVPQVVSNAVRAKLTSSNNQANQCYAIAAAAVCLTDNMATRGQLAAGQNGLYTGPIVRADANGQNMVCAMLTTDSNAYGIWTRIAGTYVRRVTAATSSIVSSDVFELRASGSTYTLIRNPDTTNATVATWPDTGGVYPTGSSYRYGGLFHHSDRNVFGTQNSAPMVDNFRVRDL